MLDTFRGHKFWLGLVVGGAVVYWGIPFVMSRMGKSGG